MSLLHRLNLSQKFITLGFIASLMVLLPSALYFKRSMADVDAAKLEVNGGGSLVVLNKVIQLTQTHGPAVREFIDWARQLQCGIDLMGPANYTVPG